MKQTNEFKRSLFENTKSLASHIPEKWFDSDKMREETTLSKTNDIVAGYSKKLEKAQKLPGLEVDWHKIKYLHVMLTLVFFAEKCYLDNEKPEIFLAFREVFRIMINVPDHGLLLAAYEHMGTTRSEFSLA